MSVCNLFMANLARNPLSRECGTRPVFIIQNNAGNANSGRVIVVTVTSRHKKRLPAHVLLFKKHGVKRPSVALCESIFTIEKSCLLNYMGTIVNTEAERQLDEALRVSLSLQE